MVRAIFVFIAALTLASAFAGCALPETALPPSQPRDWTEETSATYYNGYLGLAVTVPEGWYETDINSYNLTQSPRESEDPYSLDLYDYGDGGYSIDLITLENTADSAMDSHAELMLYADYYPGVGEDEYLDWMSDYIVDRTDGEYYYELLDVGEQSVNGQRYTRYLAMVSFSDGSKPYYEEYYITPVNDMFFVAYINYWSDSKKSKSAAYSVLENAFSLGGGNDWQDNFGTDPGNPIQSV